MIHFFFTVGIGIIILKHTCFRIIIPMQLLKPFTEIHKERNEMSCCSADIIKTTKIAFSAKMESKEERK